MDSWLFCRPARVGQLAVISRGFCYLLIAQVPRVEQCLSARENFSSPQHHNHRRERPLETRFVGLQRDFPVQTVVFDVPCIPHDLTEGFQSICHMDSLADGVLIGKEMPGHGLIDHGNTERPGDVMITYKHFYSGAQGELGEARKEIGGELGVARELPGGNRFLRGRKPGNSLAAPSFCRSRLRGCSGKPRSDGRLAEEWGLTIAANHQLMKIGDQLIRAEMLRGPRYTSVKVVRDQQVTSMQYPPCGTYVFRYSLSSARGDWKAGKAYRAGMDFNNPLLPVSVADRISRKSLPPSRSFSALGTPNLVISAVKKSDLDSAILLRVYEIEGSQAETAVEFLGQKREFREVNLLEEDAGPAGQKLLKASPYAIKTLKLEINR